jgi:hypothetical protein
MHFDIGQKKREFYMKSITLLKRMIVFSFKYFKRI